MSNDTEMMGNPFPAAADLRAKLNTAASLAAKTQIQTLLTKISRAVEAGGSQIYVEKFEPGVETLLKERGYTVTFVRAQDQRDTSYHAVSW